MFITALHEHNKEQTKSKFNIEVNFVRHFSNTNFHIKQNSLSLKTDC
jgi:hypothetical protein